MSENRIIRGLPRAEYHALQMLNASGAHTIERDCPAAYFHTSPLNPDAAQSPPAKHFDIGSATHLLLLEPEKFDESVVIIDAANYTTKAAQIARDRAHNAGLTPLLPKDVQQVEAMARAILADPIAGAFRDGGGESEVTMTWTDPDFGFPCKLRVDFLPDNFVDLRDIKSCATANPRDFERSAWDHGYPQRAAWYLDGVEIETGTRPRYYWFVAVEKKPPWLVSVMKYRDEDIEWGRNLNQLAREMFADCLGRGVWPGYRPPGAPRERAFEIGIPKWARYELQDRADTGEIALPRSRAELNRMTVKNRLAAKLAAPSMDRDYMP